MSTRLSGSRKKYISIKNIRKIPRNPNRTIGPPPNGRKPSSTNKKATVINPKKVVHAAGINIFRTIVKLEDTLSILSSFLELFFTLFIDPSGYPDTYFIEEENWNANHKLSNDVRGCDDGSEN